MKEIRQRVFISGPMTGTTDYMERFARTEEKLNADGFTSINPAKVNAQLPGDTTYEEYMEMSMTMLKMADAIYMLKGWSKSKGAILELAQALSSNKEIIVEGE